MARRLGVLGALLLVASPLSGQGFGSQVAVSDGEILIAEPLRGGPATLYRYGLSGGEWEQVGTLTAPSAGTGGDYFGRVVLVDERSMIIGGTTYQESTGGVWAYRRDASEWVFDQILQPDSIVEGEAFGRFGVLDGDRLFVSSLGFRGAGAVWLFERDDVTGSWSQQARIQPLNPIPQQFFGWGLAYDGERLLVGSLDGIESGTGAAYVFVEEDEGRWIEEARLALPDDEAAPFDAGGPGGPGTIGVGWFEGMALLGLPGRADGEGAAYTFRRDPVTEQWVRGTTLSAFDRRPGSSFGHGFHVRDGELWVSAPGAGLGGNIYAFSYDAATGEFSGSVSITNTIDVDVDDGFGFTVVTQGDLAVVGQTLDDNGLGSVVVLRNRDGEWTSEAKLLIPFPEGPSALAGSEVACGADGTAEGFGCSDVSLLSFLPVRSIGGTRGSEMNDVWGWTDPETGREYVIGGRTDGTAFVDVTDPVNPRYVGNLRKTRGSVSSAWRDMKVFGNHVFVVADGSGPHGMQVFDLTRLRSVTGDPQNFDADLVYRRIASAHNIAINEETGIAYAVGANSGGETCGGGLHMIDINEPRNPVFAGCFQHAGTGRSGSGYTHDAMCTIYHGPDLDHVGREICFGANETALSIADVTDKSAPVALGSATYPNVAYAHQGWITEDHRYFFLDDELDEGEAQRDGPMAGTRTLVWDVSDLDDPVLALEHFGETLTTDHNLYIRGDLMYQSNYQSGLRILNIRDPLVPFEVAYFDTVPDDESVRMDGSWSNYPYFESGTIAVTSRQEGLFLVRHNPRELLP